MWMFEEAHCGITWQEEENEGKCVCLCVCVCFCCYLRPAGINTDQSLILMRHKRYSWESSKR